MLRSKVQLILFLFVTHTGIILDVTLKAAQVIFQSLINLQNKLIEKKCPLK